MAVGVILEVPGGSQWLYEQVMKELDLKGKLPDGGICHFAGPMDGGWRVVDVWESKEAFERFQSEKLRKAIEKTGMKPARPVIFTIHDSMIAHEAARH